MKKLWALCIVLVLVMLTIPCAFAAGADVNDPDVIAKDDMQIVYEKLGYAVSVPAKGEYYVQLEDLCGCEILIDEDTITVETGEFGRGKWYWTEVEKGTSFVAEDSQMVRLTNSDSSAAYCYIEASSAPSFGTWDNPEVVTELGDFTASVKAGSEGYYYSWTATGDGKLAVSASANDTVMVTLNNNTSYAMNSVEGEYYATATVDVSTGDEVQIIVFLGKGWESNAGDASVSMSLLPAGSIDNPYKAELNTGYTASLEAGNYDGAFYSWTATEAGTLTATASANGAFLLSLTNNTTSVGNDWVYAADTASDSIAVAAGDVVLINVAMDMDGDWQIPAGEITLSLSFTACGEDGGNDGGSEPADPADPVVEEKYVDWENEYTLDNTTVTPMDGYTYSIFKFVPSETGVYTITAPEGVLLSYWGSSTSYVGFNFTENETNSIEVEFTYGCIWVGVQADEAVTLTFTKTGDAQNNNQTSYTNAEATETPYGGDDISGWKWVNVLDGTTDTAVLGEDGYYHLNSADGPVLFVDLNANRFNIILSEANSTGALKDAVNHVQYKYLVNAYLEASDNGVVALTEELMVMLQNVGASKGWFGSNMNMNIFSKEVDVDEAWMFACKYSEDVTSLGSGNGNGNNGNGDVQEPSDDDGTQIPGDDAEQDPSVTIPDEGGNNGSSAGDNEGGNSNNNGDAGNDENPKMGDINVSMIAAALVVSAMGLAVVAKKKF